MREEETERSVNKSNTPTSGRGIDEKISATEDQTFSASNADLLIKLQASLKSANVNRLLMASLPSTILHCGILVRANALASAESRTTDINRRDCQLVANHNLRGPFVLDCLQLSLRFTGSTCHSERHCQDYLHHTFKHTLTSFGFRGQIATSC